MLLEVALGGEGVADARDDLVGRRHRTRSGSMLANRRGNDGQVGVRGSLVVEGELTQQGFRRLVPVEGGGEQRRHPISPRVGLLPEHRRATTPRDGDLPAIGEHGQRTVGGCR